MEILITVLPIVMLIILALTIYVGIRNDWVYDNRISYITSSRWKPGILTSENYDEMLFKYWYCWDFEKLISKYEKEHEYDSAANN